MSWNPLNWIPWGNGVGSVDDLQAEQDQIRAREAQLDARAREQYGESWAQATERHRAQEYQESYSKQVGDAFIEGAKEGAQAQIDAVQGAANAVTGFTLRIIPWQVYVLGAGALFWWLGGGVYLKGILGRGRK
jgi:hypothetical protein